MPTTLTFRRGSSAPTQGSGITLGEPAFDTSLKRFFIGQGTGVTAVWVGAQISGASSDVSAGLTYQIPTLAAVKNYVTDYVSTTTSGVASFEGLTGTIDLVAGTNIGITSATGSITITDYGVSAAQANTFTAVQTFNSGVTFASTTDHTGIARFANTAVFSGAVTITGSPTTVGDAAGDRFVVNATLEGITSSGAVLANAGLTASAVDVSGYATFNNRVYANDIYATSGTNLRLMSGATFNSTTDHAGAARFASTVVATGSITANGGLTASTLDVSGTMRTTGDATVGATLTVSGNLIVNGTTTTINSTTLVVDDKNIVLADGNTLDTGADGGGITLKGASDKTFNWVDSSDSWTSSEHMDLAAGKVYKIGTTTVLSNNTLGSGVVSSSLTSVGTIGTGVWQGTVVGVTYGGTGLASYTIGDVLYASGTGTLAKLPSTTSGYLLASTGAGAAPEYKQLLIKDADTNSIASSASASGTLTMTIQNATTSLKGVAKFDSTNFTVTSGNVTVTGIDGGTY